MENIHLLFEARMGEIYPLGNPIDYEPVRELAVVEQASRLGVSAEERLYDLMCEGQNGAGARGDPG